MKERLKEYLLSEPIICSFIIFMICLIIRIIEYFIIKTDTTFIFENFIHKLIGIIIVLFLLKIMNYKLKDIGFKKNNFLRYLAYGLLLGCICFGISYFIEYTVLYMNLKSSSFELYVNGFSLVDIDFIQNELAEKRNVTDKAVSKWERNLSCPDVNSIPKLAEALGTTVEELLNAQTKKENNKIDEIVNIALIGIGLVMGICIIVTSKDS